MKTPTRRVTLARSDLDYLEAASFLPPTLLACLRNAELCSATAAELDLLPATAEEFREAFTEQLARVGFDDAYEPTPEGKLLEDLIDRFYSP
jgi:hypothetical protein